MITLKNAKCDKAQIVTKLKKSNSDNSITDQTYNSLLVWTTWHLDIRWDVHWAAFYDLAMFFILVYTETLMRFVLISCRVVKKHGYVNLYALARKN